jgi:hypothetical protein
MINKEEIKAIIDRLPDEMLEDVYNYIMQIQRRLKKVHKLPPTYNLNGQFDDVDIRTKAYK